MEQESNDTADTAQNIQINSEISGFLESSDDVDFYSLDIPEDTTLRISLSAVKGINHALKIWKGGNIIQLIKIIDDSRKSSPEEVSNLTLGPGTHYISVCHGDRDKPIGTKEDPYVLSINGQRTIPEEREPNDTPATATFLPMEENFQGYFSPAYNRLSEKQDNPLREEDWYRIEISLDDDNNPHILTAQLSGVTSVNSCLSLYSSDLVQIASVDSAPSGGGESLKGIGIHSSGTYYLMVTNKGYNHNHNEPYSIIWTHDKAATDMELEPNDTGTHASKIINDRISAELNSAGDVDFFYVSGNSEKATYRLEIIPEADIDPRISIYDISFTEILKINDSGPGQREIIPAYDLPGQFLIKIEGTPSTGNGSAKYELLCSQITDTDNLEKEPNDVPEKAGRVNSTIIKGYTTFKGDRDYYQFFYAERKHIELDIRPAPGSRIRVSVTDPMGYIIQSIEAEAGNYQLNEMIDKKGFLIVETLKTNYFEPYSIRIREK